MSSNQSVIETQLKLLQITRRNMIGVAKQFTLEQRNLIPVGFGNSIAWNIGHALVTQQLLCYGRSGNPLLVDDALVNKYRSGTSAEVITEEEYLFLKSKMRETSEQLTLDYQAGLFKSYKFFASRFRMDCHTIEDAIMFNNVHEVIHLQTIRDIGRFIQQGIGI